MHASWSKYAYFGMAFSCALYGGFVALYGSFAPDGDGFAATYLASYVFYGAPAAMVASGGFWASAVAVPAACAAVDLVLLAARSQVGGLVSRAHVAREWELHGAAKPEGHLMPGRLRDSGSGGGGGGGGAPVQVKAPRKAEPAAAASLPL